MTLAQDLLDILVARDQIRPIGIFQKSKWIFVFPGANFVNENNNNDRVFGGSNVVNAPSVFSLP